MKYLIPFLLLLNSCAGTKFLLSPPSDPAFNDYIAEWASEFIYNGTPIWFEEQEGRTAAVCQIGRGVAVDPVFWAGAVERKRKALIYHELTHCIYRIGHRGKTYPDGCPQSLMNPILPTLECLERYELEYYQQLRDLLSKVKRVD